MYFYKFNFFVILMGIIHFFYGVVAMQLVYLLFHYSFFRRREYLFYILYTLCLTSFIYIRTPSENVILTHLLSPNQILIIGYAILFIALGGYLSFIRFFADAPKRHLRFNRIVKITEIILYLTALMMILCALIFGRLGPLETIAKLVYVFTIGFQLYVIYFMLQTKNIFNILIITGTIIFSFFIKLSIIPSTLLTQVTASNQPSYELFILGSIISYLFLNFTLIFKFREIEKEKLALELNKEKSLFQQRMEISNDIHDDMGARLSSLHVYSGLAVQLMEKDPQKAKLYLGRIANAVQETMSRLNDVIWAINNTEAEQKLLSSRIKDFYTDIFEAKKIVCTYDIDQSLEAKITRIVARKNLLMITKEAINNVIKHSSANRIILRLKQDNQDLMLSIEDNGLNPMEEKPNKGQGLKSMLTRALTLDGTLDVGHVTGRGTIVTCRVPVTSISG
jgi:signal transduction histidine kinase